MVERLIAIQEDFRGFDPHHPLQDINRKVGVMWNKPDSVDLHALEVLMHGVTQLGFCLLRV